MRDEMRYFASSFAKASEDRPLSMTNEANFTLGAIFLVAVIPAQAGIYFSLDPRLRGDDGYNGMVVIT